MKAYLGYPIKLVERDEELHVTVKYLGDVNRLDCAMTHADTLREPAWFGVIREVDRRLAEIKYLGLRLEFTSWRCETFDHNTKVLELFNVCPAALRVQAALASMKQDDYPKWRPHITVSHLIWHSAHIAQPSPAEWVEHIGPLTLYVDKKPVRAWD